jgi:galactokinase
MEIGSTIKTILPGMMSIDQEALHCFRNEFGKEEICLSVPSRVNIIGEHIDYCGLTVLPFATDPRMLFIMKRHQGKECSAYAFDLNEKCSFGIELNSESYAWAKYFIKILKELKRRTSVDICVEVLFSSKIPIGGGMSSSSALCCGFIQGINLLYGLNLDSKEMIDIATVAEYGMGLQGGIMDQYTLFFGQEAKVLVLDCGKIQHEYIEVDPREMKLVLINSQIRHSLVESEYNLRRKQLTEALKSLNELLNTELSFHELNPSHIDLLENPLHKKRLKHLITESERVGKSVKYIRNSNWQSLGTMLWESHESLKNDYEVSCEEIDFLVDELKYHKSVLGARIMGGGFGGNILVLLDSRTNEELFPAVKNKYFERYGIEAEVLNVKPSQGLIRLMPYS